MTFVLWGCHCPLCHPILVETFPGGYYYYLFFYVLFSRQTGCGKNCLLSLTDKSATFNFNCEMPLLSKFCMFGACIVFKVTVSRELFTHIKDFKSFCEFAKIIAIFSRSELKYFFFKHIGLVRSRKTYYFEIITLDVLESAQPDVMLYRTVLNLI